MRRVVEIAGECDRLVAVEHIGARAHVISRLGDHLQGNAGAVHVGQAAGPEVRDLVGNPAHDERQILVVGDVALRRACLRHARGERRETEMLLQRDDPHGSLFRRDG